MQKLDKRHQKALDSFTKTYKNDPNVLGIILTGSAVHSVLDKNSDLDVHIIVKNSAWRERGNTWVNGIEIEYFINPVKQVKAYFRREYEKHSAHMFVHSIILYQKGPILSELIRDAKKALNKKSSPMNKVKKELAKYHLDDLYKDVEDAYFNKDRFSFERTSAAALDSCLETFLTLKGLRTEKPKRLEKYIKQADPDFAQQFILSTKEKDYTKRLKYLRATITCVENMLGGKRSKEWKLRGPLDLKPRR